MSAEANWQDTPQNGEAEENEEMIRICINWAGLLEPVDVSPYTTVDELAGFIFSASECAVPEHKLFIYKGMLLPVDAMLCDVRVRELCVDTGRDRAPIEHRQRVGIKRTGILSPQLPRIFSTAAEPPAMYRAILRPPRAPLDL